MIGWPSLSEITRKWDTDDAETTKRKGSTGMSSTYERPDMLWSEESIPESVDEYIASYMGEFDTDMIQSGYPDFYLGKASNAFRRVTKVDYADKELRFVGRGRGCWTLRRDHPLNDLTADLLAAAEALGGTLEWRENGSSAGSFGADSSRMWISLLDGGVGASVVVWQHQNTNRLHVQHRTTVRGPRAYRVLLELLGYDWINRKLCGERRRPTQEEIIEQVNELLTKGYLA